MTSPYDRLMKQLRAQNPAHEMIPVIESMPGTLLAIEYLRISLADEVTTSPEQYTMEMLYRQRGSLYSRRAVLSNKFHQAQSNKERAEISVAIGSLQTEIIDVRHKLEHYEETGKLPALPEKLVLPASGERKRMKLHSVRTSISRYKGLIRKETDPEKIKDYERKLTKLIEQAGELSA